MAAEPGQTSCLRATRLAVAEPQELTAATRRREGELRPGGRGLGGERRRPPLLEGLALGIGAAIVEVIGVELRPAGELTREPSAPQYGWAPAHDGAATVQKLRLVAAVVDVLGGRGVPALEAGGKTVVGRWSIDTRGG